MSKKIAVVLFNLGGPDDLDAVQPFLFNLFNDPAIISLPNPFRWVLARFISKRRAPIAKDIYRRIGGKSPLLELTQQQASALESELADLGEVKCFIGMRYWHPMVLEAAERVQQFDPDQIILLPLYPQFSSTTTGSSLEAWDCASHLTGMTKKARAICCYPEEPGWIGSQVDLIKTTLDENRDGNPKRILFSAHGLPKKIVDKGDPYPDQVECTVKAIVAELQKEIPDLLDWVICYQSRVGRLEWIGPSTDDELERAGKEGLGVVVVPVAFVSEHSETLVELDIEYRELAEKVGVPTYWRVPAVGDHPKYISGLSNLVRQTLNQEKTLCSGAENGKRLCDTKNVSCPLAHSD